jgi:ATP-dependent helicase HrpB
VDLADLDAHFADQIERADEVAWDDAAGAVRARRVERLGALVLRERAAPSARPGARRGRAPRRRARRGAAPAALDAALPWSGRPRAACASASPPPRSTAPGDNVGHPAPAIRGPTGPTRRLAAELDDWLGPSLHGLRRWADVDALDLAAVLAARLTWAQRAALDGLAPTHVTVPPARACGSTTPTRPRPVLAVRLQELFGVADTPRVAGGRVALTLHLLSPAHRPVQVTRDLAGFWRSSYFDVRKDLRGATPAPVARRPARRRAHARARSPAAEGAPRARTRDGAGLPGPPRRPPPVLPAGSDQKMNTRVPSGTCW